MDNQSQKINACNASNEHTEPKSMQDMQQEVDKWIKTYGVRYFSELTNMACLTEEVGELARVMARTYGITTYLKRWRTCFGCLSASQIKRV